MRLSQFISIEFLAQLISMSKNGRLLPCYFSKVCKAFLESRFFSQVVLVYTVSQFHICGMVNQCLSSSAYINVQSIITSRMVVHLSFLRACSIPYHESFELLLHQHLVWQFHRIVVEETSGNHLA